MSKKIVSLLAVICCAAAFASPQVIFEADFTKSPNAKSKGKPSYHYPVKTGKNTKLELDKEKGLIIGEEKASAHFGIPDLLNSKSGSIEMVVRNLNWEVKDLNKHLFMQADRPGLLYFYKHSNDGVAIYFSNAESKKSVFMGNMPKWKKDTEHHLVFTWNNGDLALFIDGTKAAERKFVMPEKMPSRFFLGTPGKHPLNSNNTAIKYLKIYDSALSIKEVFQLNKNNQIQDEDIIDE